MCLQCQKNKKGTTFLLCVCIKMFVPYLPTHWEPQNIVPHIILCNFCFFSLSLTHSLCGYRSIDISPFLATPSTLSNRIKWKTATKTNGRREKRAHRREQERGEQRRRWKYCRYHHEKHMNIKRSYINDPNPKSAVCCVFKRFT